MPNNIGTPKKGMPTSFVVLFMLRKFLTFSLIMEVRILFLKNLSSTYATLNLLLVAERLFQFLVIQLQLVVS